MILRITRSYNYQIPPAIFSSPSFPYSKDQLLVYIVLLRRSSCLISYLLTKFYRFSSPDVCLYLLFSFFATMYAITNYYIRKSFMLFILKLASSSSLPNMHLLYSKTPQSFRNLILHRSFSID